MSLRGVLKGVLLGLSPRIQGGSDLTIATPRVHTRMGLPSALRQRVGELTGVSRARGLQPNLVLRFPIRGAVTHSCHSQSS